MIHVFLRNATIIYEGINDMYVNRMTDFITSSMNELCSSKDQSATNNT